MDPASYEGRPLVADTNVWIDCLVGLEAYRINARKKKSRKRLPNPAAMAALLDRAVAGGNLRVPSVIAKEVYGVARYKISPDHGIDLGKNRDKILGRAARKARRIFDGIPMPTDYDRGAYRAAEGAYAAARTDPGAAAERDRWSMIKHHAPWAALDAGTRRMQPPHGGTKDIEILATAVLAAGAGRSVLASRDADIAAFAGTIGRLLPVDVLDASSPPWRV
ncbi:MAG: hypothetical protein MPJ05_04375 [Nitrosopumilus sp.]|nr:hypothetical protein [Nitrosopumilus sp.]